MCGKGGFADMKRLGALFVFFITVGCASAQSLQPEDPYPMKAGINKGTAQNFVGAHYWYFYVTPGDSQVTVRFARAETLYGAPISGNQLSFTLSDEKRTWRTTKVVTPKRNESETTFKAEKVEKKMKIILTVTPPSQSLLRAGGDYEIEATGAVEFDEVKSAVDPIVRTYDAKTKHVGGRYHNEEYGVTKFLADGTVETASGFHGTWKLFDRESRTYVVVIEGARYSVQYRPGFGLVKPDDPTDIVFQEVRR